MQRWQLGSNLLPLFGVDVLLFVIREIPRWEAAALFIPLLFKCMWSNTHEVARSIYRHFMGISALLGVCGCLG